MFPLQLAPIEIRILPLSAVNLDDEGYQGMQP
jgi:hypothetical protein